MVQSMRRRKLMTATAGVLGCAALALPWPAQSRDSALPVPVSLPEAARAAALKGQPLVLLVSLPGCPYCELVRRSYLLPGRRDSGLQAWQLNSTDNVALLVGFDGKTTSAAEQITAWKATFTPTVLFLGPEGQELAERLVGASSPDFYGFYLEERLVQARKALQAQK